MSKTRSQMLDEAVIEDVTWRTTKVRTALDHGNFGTALDYLAECADLVKAAIQRHGDEFLAATPSDEQEREARDAVRPLTHGVVHKRPVKSETPKPRVARGF